MPVTPSRSTDSQPVPHILTSIINRPARPGKPIGRAFRDRWSRSNACAAQAVLTIGRRARTLPADRIRLRWNLLFSQGLGPLPAIGGAEAAPAEPRWALPPIPLSPSEPGAPGASEVHATPGTRPSAARSAAGRAGSASSSTPTPATTGRSGAATIISGSRRGRPPGPNARAGWPNGSRAIAPLRSWKSAAATASSSAPSAGTSTCRWSASTSAPASWRGPRATSTGWSGSAWSWPPGRGLPFADKSFDLVLTSAVILHNPPPVAEQMRLEVIRVARRFAAHNEDTDVSYNRFGYDTAAWYRAAGLPLAEAGPIPVGPDAIALAILRGRAVASLIRAASPARVADRPTPADGADGGPRQHRRDARRPARARARHPDGPGAALGARPGEPGGLHRAAALPGQHEPFEPRGRPGGRAGDPDPPRRRPRGRGPARGRHRRHDEHADLPGLRGRCSWPGPGSAPRSWPATRWRPSGPGGWWRSRAWRSSSVTRAS